MPAGWPNEIFFRFSKPRSRSEWRYLILDRHSTHTPPNFQYMAFANRVVCLYLPARTGHRLQPLDLSVFGPLKTAYSKAIEGFNHHSITGSNSKRKFVNAYLQASKEAFTY